MTRLSKVNSFKTASDFVVVLDSANVQKKKLGGYSVTLQVNIDTKTKEIHVSRNQLAKLALKLAKSQDTDPAVFSKLKEKLTELDALGVGGGRGTKIKQAIGNLFFQLTHHGKGRAVALETADSKLKNKNKKSLDSFEQAQEDLKLLADELEASGSKGPERAAAELENRQEKVKVQLRQPGTVSKKKRKNTLK